MSTSTSFPTSSPINTEKLKSQNKRVYDWLTSGNTINTIQAQSLGITALNSRISDLRNKSMVQIYDRYIKLPTGTIVKEYSIKPFEKKH